MEAFIRFIIQNNEKIVYVSGGMLCILSVVIVWWQIFGKKGLNTGDTPQVDLTGIEESLKKILSQTHMAQQSVEAGGATAAAMAAGGASSADIEALKKDLADRAKIIEDLKAQVASAKGSSDNSGELLAKIKNLEGKLAEYEIIEDDIADLSNFKEENARLKKELDAIKRGGPQLVDQFADAVAAKAAAPSAPAAEVAAPAAAPAPAPAAAPAPEATSTTAPAATPAPDVTVAATPEAAKPAEKVTVADAVAQAQAAMGVEEAAAETSAPGQPPETLDFSAPSAAVPDAAPAAPAAKAEAEPAKGDIFAEFSGGNDEADPLAALGDIDPDKMLDELKDLNADLNLGADSLNEAPDIDKMADEAVKLDKKS